MTTAVAGLAGISTALLFRFGPSVWRVLSQSRRPLRVMTPKEHFLDLARRDTVSLRDAAFRLHGMTPKEGRRPAAVSAQLDTLCNAVVFSRRLRLVTSRAERLRRHLEYSTSTDIDALEKNQDMWWRRTRERLESRHVAVADLADYLGEDAPSLHREFLEAVSIVEDAPK